MLPFQRVCTAVVSVESKRMIGTLVQTANHEPRTVENLGDSRYYESHHYHRPRRATSRRRSNRTNRNDRQSGHDRHCRPKISIGPVRILKCTVDNTKAYQRDSCSDDKYRSSTPVRVPRRQSVKQTPKQEVIRCERRLLQRVDFVSTPLVINAEHHNKRNDAIRGPTEYRQDTHARRQVHQPIISNTNLYMYLPWYQPFRIIFVRHGERADQALGTDWFHKAFRTQTYEAFDPNLPAALVKRRYVEDFQLDVPLTVHGLTSAYLTGCMMRNNNLAVDICFSSTALRCVQTCDEILMGLERRNRVAIRIEPGLFECPHSNRRIVNSFMSKRELIINRYNIDDEYKSLVRKVKVPETLDQYFQRSAEVIRGIIQRYAPYGGTALIVTHAPGILASVSAIQGVKPDPNVFYETVSNYPPLTMCFAEYDGSKWTCSNEPFGLLHNKQHYW